MDMLLEGGIFSLLDDAASIAGLVQGVEENVELLKDQLKKLRPFVEDANSKPLENKVVSEWISQIREVVDEAEDAVEMLLVNADNEKRSSSTSVGKLDIDSILDRLDGLHKSYTILDTTMLDREQTQEELHEEQVAGMEDDVQKLLRESILDEDRKGVSIAVVEGMVGIGKTALARRIYNLPDVVARFECRAWVTVSTRFSLEGTMKQLILQLPASTSHHKKLPELELELESEDSTKGKPYVQQKLLQTLHAQLKGKTYFIVLDDVWEKEHWESLWTVFPAEQGTHLPAFHLLFHYILCFQTNYSDSF